MENGDGAGDNGQRGGGPPRRFFRSNSRGFRGAGGRGGPPPRRGPPRQSE